MSSPTDSPAGSVTNRSQAPHFVDGHWSAGGQSPLVSTEPGSGQNVWLGTAADAPTVDAAVQAARQAWPKWQHTPLEQRMSIARAFQERVKTHADQLTQLISREVGKPLWEAATEVSAVAGKVDLAIDALQTRRSQSEFTMGDYTAVTRYRPLGVLGVLGPYNFPAHLPNGHIVPALLAGNTVVFKPSEMTPAVGQWMIEQWEQAGLPAGVINLVQGARETGAALANHDAIDGLLFTGSSGVGKSLHAAFAGQPQKILALEMGGNNPLIVHEAGDLQAAAYLAALSAYLTSGQRCTCARRLILVEGSEAERFLAALVEMIGRIRVGLYNDSEEPFMGTVISPAVGQRMLTAQQALIDSGAHSLVSLEKQRDLDALLSPGLIDVTGVPDRSDEELFGPLLNVIRVPDFDAALAEANNTRYGLSAGLISHKRENYDRFISEIRAGVVNWNRQTTGASGKLPFGGCGLSGNFRPSGYFAADYCSFPVASMESAEFALPEKLMPGFAADTIND